MRKSVIGFITSALLFGLLAGLSSASTVDSQVSSIQDTWAGIQSIHSPDLRLRYMSALDSRAERLAQKYPQNSAVRAWAEVVNRSTSALRQRVSEAG
ncbi:MAG TPA: hypothetical protein VKA32_05835 [Gammaproteobacteria bacterium]|nr:hypothetical protein [Gammaproteobacteria bacterium]